MTTDQEAFPEMDEREILRFDALRNAFYHSSRRKTYEVRHRWLMAIIAISTTTLFARISSIGSFELLFAAVPVLASLTDLIFSPGEKAKNHQVMQKQFFELLADLEFIKLEDEEALSGIRSKMLRIYGDEETNFRVLDAVSYNAALESMGRDSEDRLIVSSFQFAFRNLLSFENVSFRSEKELKAIKHKN